ncbi:MAG: oxygen-independent coproporphyrinogen III oxidase [Cyclobacteriaceae bacterium]
MKTELIKKYNIPGPRYTSYPTVPYWDTDSFSSQGWKDSILNTFWSNGKEISIYVHLPFCESLCTYCGCNTRITKNHSVEEVYINALLKEWEMYLSIFPSRPIVKELHLGGGTPTFFSPANLEKLIEGILSKCTVSSNPDMAFEGHPNNTTPKHLQALFNLGFKRVSFGIQDFDPHVQKLINRIQSFENVESATQAARKIGYESVNFDLIYGLPGQTNRSVQDTIAKTLGLKPDRIAFYSYAHVPNLKPSQRAYESSLPTEDEKQLLYESGKSMLIDDGYQDIGMDHFALPHDPMYKVWSEGNLHRNFMGYTTQKTNMVIGLGVSAISDTWTAFAQNVKKIETYYDLIENDQMPILKGHVMTRQDLVVRKKILDLICKYETEWTEEELLSFGLEINFELLEELQADNLIFLHDNGLKVLEAGKPFIRNTCMPFDVRMWNTKEKEVFFSKTI